MKNKIAFLMVFLASLLSIASHAALKKTARVALIKDGKVANVIVVDDPTQVQPFLASYDTAKRIDTLSPEPQIGWDFNAADRTFSPSAPVAPDPTPEEKMIDRIAAKLDAMIDAKLAAKAVIAAPETIK